MKILELPVDTTIECECGCKFEFDVGYDTNVISIYSDYLVGQKIVVDCPFCEKRHNLKTIEKNTNLKGDE